MKWNKITIIFGLYILIGLLITCKPAELVETTGNITGTVTNKTTNEPIAGAIVTLTPGNTSTGTGSDGKFNYKELEAKEFTIQVVKDGFKTNSKNITVIAARENMVDIQLEPFKPVLTVLPTNLDFGTIETNKSVQISNTGLGNLSWTASTTDNFISFSPSSGIIVNVGVNPVAVTVNRSNMNAGTYNGSIIFNSNSNSFTLPVTMTVPVPGVPSIVCGAAQNITQTTAGFSGQLTSIGSSTVSQYGHCWSTNPAPTTLDAKTNLGSTSSPLNFSSTLTGLTASKTYYVRAYAINSVGIAYSSEITFMTNNTPTPPSVTTSQATSITLATANIAGNIIDIGSSNVIEHGHCWSTSPAPTINNSKTSLGSKSSTGVFSSNLTGLSGNAMYYVRAYATNNVGTNYSDEISFTTQTAIQATVTTGVASNITFTTFSISGSVTDMGNSPITQYGHCWSTTSNPTISNNITSLGTLNSTGTFSSNLLNLTVGTKYYVKAYSTNSAGTSYGSEVIVQTNSYIPATVETGSPSNITYTSFTVSGNITDLGNTQVTQYGLCWSTTANPTILNNLTTLGAIATIGAYNSNVTGLTANTKYYVRSYATNTAGTSYGTEITVSTNAYSAPTVNCDNASNVNFTSADVTGYITSIGYDNAIQYGHCWSTTPNPTTSNNKTQLGSATGAKSFTSNLTGLTLNTTYYVRAYAINSIGTSYSSQVQFTTLSPSLPGVTTGTSSNVQGTSADISGNITSLGDLTLSQYGHCWSTSPTPTIADNKTTLGSKTTTGQFTSNLTGLSTNTKYYVRAYATNGSGTSYGSEINFTTSLYVVMNGLVAFYPFDDGTAKDYLNQNSAIVVNNVIPSTDNQNGSGKSMNFSGNQSYIQFATNLINNFITGSFNLWIKTSSSNCAIFTSTNNPYQWYFFDGEIINGKYHFGTYSGSTFNVDLSTVLLNNQWHMLTMTIKAGEQKLYVDGVLIGNLNESNGILGVGSNDGFLIGNSDSSPYYKGLLDNFRIYNRILSQSEITEIFNAKQ